MAARKKQRQKKSAAPDFWENLPNKKKHIYCLAFLFVLPFILYFSSTLGGQQYMGHDVLQWRAGAESLIEHRETHDEVAHWAENMFSGMPATTISHPPQIWNVDNTLLRGLSFIYPAVEYWILFGGAYLMFLLMGFRPLTAVFGSIVIGFSTYIPIIIGAGHNAKFLSYIYIPWIVSGYFLITKTQINRWLAFFVFGLALTLHLRAYHPQVTYFFLFPLGAMFLYDLFKAYKQEAINKFAKHSGWLIGAAVVAILISVQLYWSTAEYSTYSMRGGSEVENTEGLSQDYAFAWSQGVQELLTLVIPGSQGGASGDAYWGPKSFTSGPHYMGALTLLFFILGLMKARHRYKWIFFGGGFATMLFSLGENFMALNGFMFNYFPLFDKFRAPEMWLMVTVFCFAVIAVMGVDWVLDQIKQKRGTKQLKKALAIAGGVAVIFIYIGFQGLSFEKEGERQQLSQQIAQQNEVPIDDPRVAQTVDRYISNELIPEREDMARGDTIRFALIFGIGIAAIFLIIGGKVTPFMGIATLCAVLAIDMIQVDNRYLSEDSLVDGDISREQVIEQNRTELDQYIQNNNLHDEGWKYRTLPLLGSPFNDATPAYFYPSIGGYSGAKLGYYQDVIDEAIFAGRAGINLGLMNMLNVRYITARGPVQIPGLETVQQTQDGVVLENQNVLPKAWFVDRVETRSNQPEILREISQDFDPSSVAFTTQEPELNIQPDADSRVRITNYNANSISLELSRSEPGYLVLGEIWYPPGWTATLNGEEIDIIRTNYILRGFEIPEGEHELTLTLDPVWYSTGNWLARLGTVILFGGGIYGALIFYRRRDETAGKTDGEEHDQTDPQ